MFQSFDARLRLFAGAVLISFSPVFVALVDVAPTVSAFYRVLIGGTALAFVWLVGQRRSWLDRRAVAMLLAAAVCFALDLWFWHRSILYIGPGRSTLLANLQVFFMLAAGVVLLAERPRRVQVFAAVLAVAGLVLMLGPRWFEPAINYRAGVVLGVLTAASYAAYLLCLRAARLRSRTPSPVPEVAVVSLGAALILGLSAAFEGESLAVAAARDFAWLAAYGLLAHAGGVMLIASSLNRVAPGEAGIALLLQPVLSFVWDVLFFGGPVAAHEAAGAVLTLAGIYLGSVRRAPARTARL